MGQKTFILFLALFISVLSEAKNQSSIIACPEAIRSVSSTTQPTPSSKTPQLYRISRELFAVASNMLNDNSASALSSLQFSVKYQLFYQKFQNKKNDNVELVSDMDGVLIAHQITENKKTSSFCTRSFLDKK